jgi:tetratricopeptide (TPR) repeat protein
MRILTIIVILAALAGGAWYMGWFKVGKDGTITATPPAVTAPEMDDYDRGLAAFTASNYPEAITSYKKAIAKDPNNEKAAAAYYRIAVSYDEQNTHPKEAIAAYKEFLTKFPKHEWHDKANKRYEFLANSSH